MVAFARVCCLSRTCLKAELKTTISTGQPTADIITPTVLLIPTSTPPFSSATLNMATSYVPQSSGVPLQQSSPASEVSSPSLPHPHVTISSTRGGYMAETMPISLC